MKYKDYFIALPMMLLAVFPPILGCRIPMVPGDIWLWLATISGFFGVYLLFVPINLFFRIAPTILFISCFFSSGLAVSFNLYLVLIIIFYYYVLCLKIADWSIVKRGLYAVLFLNGLFLIMQLIGKDSLLNFGLGKITCYGTVGNSMQLKTLLFLSAGFLIADTKIKNRKIFISYSLFLVFSMFVYFFSGNNDSLFKVIRWPAWTETIRIANERPLWGWGLGSFKPVFNAMVKNKTLIAQGTWFSPHNDYCHILFEVGRIFLFIFLSYLISLYYRLIKMKLYYPVSGLFIFCMGMMFYFPLTQPQTILIVMCFYAYLEQRIKVEKGEEKNG